MPRILTLQNVGRTIRAGQIRTLPQSTIQAISAQVGNDKWYQMPDYGAKRLVEQPQPGNRQLAEAGGKGRKAG